MDKYDSGHHSNSDIYVAVMKGAVYGYLYTVGLGSWRDGPWFVVMSGKVSFQILKSIVDHSVEEVVEAFKQNWQS